MQNIHGMKLFQSNHWLDKDTPNLILLKQIFIGLMFGNLLVKVSIVCIFHDDAKVFLLNKDLFVTDNLFIFNGG